MADGLRVTLELANPEIVEKIKTLGDTFEREAQKTFLGFIFEVHKYLIRVTPIDTGELRGGWTAFLDKNNVDYARQIYDISIADKAPGRDYHISEIGIQEGKGLSQFEAPNPFDITIINSVPYALYLEEGTSRMAGRNFVALTRYKAELLYQKVFDAWFRKIQTADDILPADDPEEITA